MKIIIDDSLEMVENKGVLFTNDNPENLSIELLDDNNIRYSIELEDNRIILRVISGSRHLKIRPVASNSIEIDSEY